MTQINKKILIVDDDPGLRMVLEENFLKEGFSVFTAENGEDGLIMVKKENPDMVLIDVLMPKMNGIDMAKKIREENNGVSIIFLTNLSDITNISNAIQASPSDYIVKSDTKTEDIVRRVKDRLGI